MIKKDLLPEKMRNYYDGIKRENQMSLYYDALTKSKKFTDIFDDIVGKERPEAERLLSEKYHEIVRVVHPDMFVGNLLARKKAEEATLILNGYYDDARKMIYSSDDYGFSFGGFDYKINGGCLEGDFCSVYFGERKGPAGTQNICLKTSQKISDNSLLENESRILKKIQHKSIPVLLDSFKMKNGKTANVELRIENGYDMEHLKSIFPEGIPQEHAAWIMDRLLSVVGYLHQNYVIHGSISPTNILVTPHNHNAILIDYTLAIERANEDGAAYMGVNDFSAPEVEKKAKPHPASDMYSLGKTMAYVMGAEKNSFPDSVDERISKFVSGFLHKDPAKRRDDAWKSWHELTKLRKDVFGDSHQFLELNVNSKR